MGPILNISGRKARGDIREAKFRHLRQTVIDRSCGLLWFVGRCCCQAEGATDKTWLQSHNLTRSFEGFNVVSSSEIGNGNIVVTPENHWVIGTQADCLVCLTDSLISLSKQSILLRQIRVGSGKTWVQAVGGMLVAQIIHRLTGVAATRCRCCNDIGTRHRHDNQRLDCKWCWRRNSYGNCRRHQEPLTTG